MPVNHVKSAEEFNQSIGNKDYSLTVVKFTAKWCYPCKMIQPHYEKLATENTNVQFLEVDVDELHDVAQKEQIRAMPTFVVYKDGARAGRELQGASPDKLKLLVKSAQETLGNGPAPGPTPAAPRRPSRSSSNDEPRQPQPPNDDDRKSGFKRCTIL